VAVFRGTIAGSHAAPRESRLPCASAHHPRRPSQAREGDPAGDGGNLPHAPDSRSSSDRFGSRARGDAVVGRSSMPRWPRPARGGRPTSSARESVRAAQACDGPAVKARSRFRRSGPDTHAAAPHFFYPRPLLAQPALHFVFVLLTGSEARLLRRDPPFGEPLIEVPRMKLDPPLAVDHSRYARGGPQLSGKSETLGRTSEPSQNLTLLPAAQLPRASARIAPCQCTIASATIGFHPATHGAGMNTHELGDGSLPIAGQNMADSQSPPPFQLLLESWRPHTYLYACTKTPVQRVALLF